MKTSDPVFDWCDDASADNKAAMVESRFGGQIPDHLWYAFAPELQLREAVSVASVLLFQGEALVRTNIEPHRSTVPGVRRSLCVRGATRWLPKLRVGGRDCFLYAIGQAFDDRFFSFYDQWTRAKFRPGTRVVAKETMCDAWTRVYGTESSQSPFDRGNCTVVETRFCSPREFPVMQARGGFASGGAWVSDDDEPEIVIIKDEGGGVCKVIANFLEEAQD